MTTDGELLRAWSRERDESAFAEIVRRHGGLALNTAGGVLGRNGGGAVAVEDVAQAVFLALSNHAGHFAIDASVAGWIYRVARRIALNALDRNLRAGRLVRARTDEVARSASGTPGSPPGQVDTPASALDKKLHLEELERVLSTLPAHELEPILLHHREGLSRAEAAARLELSEAAFAKRLERGREKLRQKLRRAGVGLGIGALAVALGESGTAAEMPADLIAKFVPAAGVAIPPVATALAEGVSPWEWQGWPKAFPWPTVGAVGVLALAILTLGMWRWGAGQPPKAAGDDRPAPPTRIVSKDEMNARTLKFKAGTERDFLDLVATRTDWLKAEIIGPRHLGDDSLDRLSRCWELEELVIKGVNGTWDGTAVRGGFTGAGFAKLARLPRLRTIDLMSLDVDDRKLDALWHCPALATLRIYTPATVTDSGFAHADRCQTLEVLHIAGIGIVGRGRSGLIACTGPGLAPLGRCARLRELYVDMEPENASSASRFDDSYFGLIADAVRKWTRYTPATQGEKAIDGLWPLEHMESLNLGRADLPDRTIRRIASRWPRLGYFNSASRLPGDSGFMALAALPLLKSLVYCGSCTDQGLESLRNHANLEALYLMEDKGVGDRGLEALASCPRMKHFFINGHQVTDAGLASLLDAPFPERNALREIGLLSPRLTDASLLRVARLTSLSNLHFGRSDQFTDQGTAALSTSPRLAHLYLHSANRLTDRSLETFADMASLRRVSLSERAAFTKEGLARLRAAKPKLIIDSVEKIEKPKPSTSENSP